MSTAKPPAQAALDDYDEGQILPAPFKLPALTCEICGTSSVTIPPRAQSSSAPGSSSSSCALNSSYRPRT